MSADYPEHYLLSEFFDIDRDAIEREKREMVDPLRTGNNPAGGNSDAA